MFFRGSEESLVVLDIQWLMNITFTLLKHDNKDLCNNGRITSLASQVPLYTKNYINKLLEEEATPQQVLWGTPGGALRETRNILTYELHIVLLAC